MLPIYFEYKFYDFYLLKPPRQIIHSGEELKSITCNPVSKIKFEKVGKVGLFKTRYKVHSLFYEDWRALNKRQELDLKLFRTACVAAFILAIAFVIIIAVALAFAIAYAFLQAVTWICL